MVGVMMRIVLAVTVALTVLLLGVALVSGAGGSALLSLLAGLATGTFAGWTVWVWPRRGSRG